MAKKKVRKAAPKAAGRARTTMKKVARRATAARKSAKTAINRAARTTAKTTKSVKKVAASAKKVAASAKKVAASAKKAASKQMKAATKKVKAATKQVGAVVQKAKVQQQSVTKSASNALGKAANLAKAMKAGVTAALTPTPALAAKGSKARPQRPPSLDRARRTVQEIHGAPSTLGVKPGASAAKSGGDDLKHKLQRHTSSSPALTAGDVDADWESADSSGDEAPGGDNPTPDQDVVDEIGRALGVEYDDDEELQGGDEIADRDRHRWELDPSSAEDSDDRD